MSLTRAPNTDRKPLILERLRVLFSELSGISASEFNPSATFLESGLDSLFLTQASAAIHKSFGVKIRISRVCWTILPLSIGLSRAPGQDPSVGIAGHPEPCAPVQAGAGGTFKRSRSRDVSGGESAWHARACDLTQQLELMRNQLEMIRRGAGTGSPQDIRHAPWTSLGSPLLPRRRLQRARSVAPVRIDAAQAAHGPYRPIARGVCRWPDARAAETSRCACRPVRRAHRRV